MSKAKKQPSKINSEYQGSSHITEPGTNIFLDLGFPEKEAAELWAKSKERIALRQVKVPTKKTV